MPSTGDLFACTADPGEGFTPFANVLFDLELDPDEAIVLLALARALHLWPEDFTTAFGDFSLDQLSSLCFGMRPATVARIVSRLIDRGFLNDLGKTIAPAKFNTFMFNFDPEGHTAPANEFDSPCIQPGLDNGPSYETWKRYIRLRRVDELRAMPYADYLMSPEWKARREVEIERAGNRCELCNSPGPFHVHHRTYERRGNEAPGDLIVLCPPCHQSFHEHRTLAGEGQ